MFDIQGAVLVGGIRAYEHTMSKYGGQYLGHDSQVLLYIGLQQYQSS